jgi:hypothetical protein
MPGRRQAGALGFAAGNVARYDKAAFSATMGSLKMRQMRYAKAPSPRQESLHGGFTAEERAGMVDDDDWAPPKTAGRKKK